MNNEWIGPVIADLWTGWTDRQPDGRRPFHSLLRKGWGTTSEVCLFENKVKATCMFPPRLAYWANSSSLHLLETMHNPQSERLFAPAYPPAEPLIINEDVVHKPLPGLNPRKPQDQNEAPVHSLRFQQQRPPQCWLCSTSSPSRLGNSVAVEENTPVFKTAVWADAAI